MNKIKIISWTLFNLFLLPIPSLIQAETTRETEIPVFPETSADPRQTLPDGWVISKETETDFNGDSLKDLVIVSEHSDLSQDQSDSPPPRILVIYFAEKKSDQKLSYRKIIQNNNAILGPQDGGVYGEPFDDLTVKKNSFILSFYGGSAWRWGSTWQFRWQNGEFFLIGHKSFSHHTNSEWQEVKEYNLSTGQMHHLTVTEEGKRSAKKINRGKKKLMSLKEFNIFSEEENF